MSMGDAAIVIGRAVAGVILCASGLAVYNEGVVPLIRRRRMLKEWPSEEDLTAEELALLDEGTAANDIKIQDNKVGIIKQEKLVETKATTEIQKPTTNVIRSMILDSEQNNNSNSNNNGNNKMNNIKPSIISNNNNGPTQKQLEARRRIEEQMKNKKTTQRTNVNKTKVAITVTDTKEIINDIDKKDMGNIGTGIRVYDWSSKWK